VVDVDAARRDRLADGLRAHHPGLVVETGAAEPEGFEVIVNCTPLGMRADDPLPVDPQRIRPGSLVVDVVLKAPRSRLLQEAEMRGCPVQGGRAMLEGQVEAVLRFFGLGPPPVR
jgi:shikimate dehydrogenase